MNNVLEVMEKRVLASKNRVLESSGVSILEDGKSLVLKNSYFNFLVKLPYFNLLSVSEQHTVQEIFEISHSLNITEQFNYHYDNDQHAENGYSYIVDNLRYIISLPEGDSNVSIIKFLMIVSLGKMKFLSKRNVDLMFAARNIVVNVLRNVQKNNKTIDTSFEKDSTLKKYSLEQVLKSSVKINFEGCFYSDKAEELSYLRLTFIRWGFSKKMTLHEVIMMQEVFGNDLPILDLMNIPKRINSANSLLGLFISAIAQYYKGSFNTLKFLFDKKSSDGIINAKISDVQNYSNFFQWIPPFIDERSKSQVYSLADFIKTFSVEEVDHEIFYNFLEKHLEADSYSMKNLKKSSKSNIDKYYFFFCLLKGDEEKTLELINALENADSPKHNIVRLSQKERYEFLNFVKEYAKDDSNIPMSLLFNMNGFDFS